MRDDAVPAPLSRASPARRSGSAPVRQRLRRHAIRLVYRLTGLPIATRALFERPGTPPAVVRSAYARMFWRPRRPSEWGELGLALSLWPVLVPLAAIWFTWRNGSVVARRDQRPLHLQLLDQIRLYISAGVLPPWYYIFELYRRPEGSHARSYAYRAESKGGVLSMLKDRRRSASVLSNKAAFAEKCALNGIAAIPLLAIARGGKLDWVGNSSELAVDWFVKPIDGKGGRGIERWDYAGDDRFRSSNGDLVHRDQLLRRIAAGSHKKPRLLQPRMVNHPDLQDLSNGALATIRALTCLNEAGDPELLGAVLRMAVGGNHVVDNFHAGGIAAAIDPQTGVLGPASNLGADARLGWLDAHPDSGAAIRGRPVPQWDQLAPFVERAHRVFSERVLIGWDVAMTPEGPVLVEANGSPDLDIMQRCARRGLMDGRLGELLAHHLEAAERR